MASSFSRAALVAALAALALPSAAAAVAAPNLAVSLTGDAISVSGAALGGTTLFVATSPGVSGAPDLIQFQSTTTDFTFPAECTRQADVPAAMVSCPVPTGGFSKLDIQLDGLDAASTVGVNDALQASTFKISDLVTFPVAVRLSGTGVHTVDAANLQVPVRIETGDDNDVVTGGNLGDHIDSGAGNDAVNSGNGDDQVVGGAGNDVINTGNGADAVWAGEGADTVHAGSGEAVGDGGFGDYIEGEGGDDQLYGDAGNDWLLGGAGNDRLSGDDEESELTVPEGAGNDRLEGDAGDDVLNGAPGNDDLRGGVGDDDIYGGDGDDEARGGAGGDYLVLGSGDDMASGDEDNDFFAGGAGEDGYAGDAGDDYFDASSDSGRDFYSGDDGIDEISYGERDGAVTIELAENDTNTNYNGGDGEDDGLTSIENASGGYGDDRIVGNSGANVLNGRSGSDVITGQSGADTLFGGSGSDHLDARVYDGIDVDATLNCDEGPTESGSDIVSLGAGDPAPVNCSDRAPGLTGNLKLTGTAVIGQALGVTGVTAFDNDAASGAVVAPITEWYACQEEGCERVGEGAAYTVKASDAGRFLHAETSVTRDFNGFYTGDWRGSDISAQVAAVVTTPPVVTPPVVIPPAAPTFEQGAANSAAQQLGAGATQLKVPQFKNGELLFQAPSVRKKTLRFHAKKPTPVFGIACATACKVTATQTVLLPASSKKSKAKKLTLKAKKLTTSGNAVSPITFAPTAAQRKLIAANKKAKLTVVLSVATGTKKAKKVTKTFTLAAAKATKKTGK